MSNKDFYDHFQNTYAKDNIEIIPASTVPDITSIPTGIISFDVASGIGGFPMGRIVEVFGPESGGKSLLTLVACAHLHSADPDATVLYFDIEGCTPREWLSVLGIDLDRFDIVPSGLSAEQNFDGLVSAIKLGNYRYIILDSVAGLLPTAELEGKIDQNYIATLARVMSKGLKKVLNTLSEHNDDSEKDAPCVIFINQTREKTNVMYGSPEVTPGGKALKFYSAQRYRITKKSQSQVKVGGDVIGHTIAIRNVKNKLGPPQRYAEFAINYTSGVDVVKTLKTAMKAQKLYTKKGQKYILTLDGEDPMEFDKVSDIDEKLALDLKFQQAIYQQIMKAHVGTYVAGEIPEDITENPHLISPQESEGDMEE